LQKFVRNEKKNYTYENVEEAGVGKKGLNGCEWCEMTVDRKKLFSTYISFLLLFKREFFLRGLKLKKK
jgi:hypothetical protein